MPVIDIDRIAMLAKLNLTPEEKILFAKQLADILAYVSALQEVDTSGVDARAYITNAINVFRDDIVTSTDSERDAVVAAFPKKNGTALEVPGIFAE